VGSGAAGDAAGFAGSGVCEVRRAFRAWTQRVRAMAVDWPSPRVGSTSPWVRAITAINASGRWSRRYAIETGPTTANVTEAATCARLLIVVAAGNDHQILLLHLSLAVLLDGACQVGGVRRRLQEMDGLHQAVEGVRRHHHRIGRKLRCSLYKFEGRCARLQRRHR